MAGERLTLWTSAAAAAATIGAVAVAAFVIWNVTGKERAQFTSQVAALNAQVNALNDKVEKTNVTVADIKKIATLEDTAKALDRLNGEIRKTNERLGAMQKDLSLEGVKATLAQLDSKIDKTDAALAGLKKFATADLVKSDLTGVETRLTSLAADIQAKLAATDKSLAELKVGIADNASSQNKPLAEIAQSIAALKTTASATQVTAQQAAQKVEKAPAVARAPEPPAPETTASIPITQPLIVSFGAADRAHLDAQTNTAIANLKTLMKGRHGCTISVAGYTDTLGRDDVNLDVSKERADAIAAKLKTAFYDQNVRIDSVGWGERKLKVWTPDGTRNMANRRVAVSVGCKG